MQVGRVSVVGPLSGVVNVIDDACEIKRMLMLMLLLHSDSKSFQTRKKTFFKIQSEKVVDCGVSLRESSVENLGRAAQATREKRFV